MLFVSHFTKYPAFTPCVPQQYLAGLSYTVCSVELNASNVISLFIASDLAWRNVLVMDLWCIKKLQSCHNSSWCTQILWLFPISAIIKMLNWCWYTCRKGSQWFYVLFASWEESHFVVISSIGCWQERLWGWDKNETVFELLSWFSEGMLRYPKADKNPAIPFLFRLLSGSPGYLETHLAEMSHCKSFLLKVKTAVQQSRLRLSLLAQQWKEAATLTWNFGARKTRSNAEV